MDIDQKKILSRLKELVEEMPSFHDQYEAPTQEQAWIAKIHPLVNLVDTSEGIAIRTASNFLRSPLTRGNNISNIKGALFRAIAKIETKLALDSPIEESSREPTGWDRVDRALSKANAALQIAKNEEDFQGVGLLCREVLISLAQEVYDPTKHATLDGVSPSNTDAKRMIEAFISSFGGESNEKIRKHSKASLELAVELQHKRTAEFRHAAMCLEATSSTVNVASILIGKRDPAEMEGKAS